MSKYEKGMPQGDDQSQNEERRMIISGRNTASWDRYISCRDAHALNGAPTFRLGEKIKTMGFLQA